MNHGTPRASQVFKDAASYAHAIQEAMSYTLRGRELISLDIEEKKHETANDLVDRVVRSSTSIPDLDLRNILPEAIEVSGWSSTDKHQRHCQTHTQRSQRKMLLLPCTALYGCGSYGEKNNPELVSLMVDLIKKRGDEKSGAIFNIEIVEYVSPERESSRRCSQM
jgi:hypothetical protein